MTAQKKTSLNLFILLSGLEGEKKNHVCSYTESHIVITNQWTMHINSVPCGCTEAASLIAKILDAETIDCKIKDYIMR